MTPAQPRSYRDWLAARHSRFVPIERTRKQPGDLEQAGDKFVEVR